MVSGVASPTRLGVLVAVAALALGSIALDMGPGVAEADSADLMGSLAGAGSLGSADGTGSAGSSGSAGGGESRGIRLVNSVTVPTGTQFQGTTIGGLSGIDYDPAQGAYVVISDDKGGSGPVRAYTLRLPIDTTGRLAAPQFETVVELRDPAGQPYPPGSTDTEAVRWTEAQGLAYTSEGMGAAHKPFVREAGAGGALLRDLGLPHAYYPAPGAGIRPNFGFEGMTLAADRSAISVMTENALVQDGPAAAPEVRSPSRLLTVDRESSANLGEYVYLTDPMFTSGVVVGPSLAGVSELLALDDDSYLVLERSFAAPRGFVVTLYRATTQGADPVTGLHAITGAERVMPKTEVFNFSQLGFGNNIEGMTWGPLLPNGDRSLVLVADNNFGQVGTTTFYLLAVGPDSGI